MQFWLGSHRPHWLALVPHLMVSHRTLRERKSMPRACGPWVLDSGGFTELNMHGKWVTTATEYVDAVERYAAEIGHMTWAAPRDWMCEPSVIAKTGLSVREHQERTVADYIDLIALSNAPFIPVLQGWEPDEYWQHITMYLDAGVDLRECEVVGLGTVCRRAATGEIVRLVDALSAYGLALHGFGVKRTALRAVGQQLASADSMAWSYNARRNPPLASCTHRSCGNCIHWALRWRDETLAQISCQDTRLPLWGAA